ncbi:MAG: DUF983 domain-containing protein [Gemmatimonadota bacterium]
MTLIWRALRLRCPNCEGGPLFSRWVKMRGSCPSCQLLLDRGEGDYFLGGYTINFLASELFIVLGAGVGIVLTWPDVPWRLLTWSLVLLMLVAPVIFYPFAKTLWLATDLIFRPLTLKDLEGHGENSPTDPDGDERPARESRAGP